MAESIHSTFDEGNVTPELLVKHHNGTTMEEVVLVSYQLPLFLFLALYVELACFRNLSLDIFKSKPIDIYRGTIIFLLESSVIVVPITLMFTLLSDYLNYVAIFITLVTFSLIVNSVSHVVGPTYYWKLPQLRQSFLSETFFPEKQPFITYFRSMVLLVTAISILGVDFHVFPRRFAKTETYGVSLMDLGVGLFIISNALVKSNKISQSVRKALFETSVFLVLGMIRYLSIQRLNYEKHVSEYGIHWNFFYTLGFVKLFSHFLNFVSRGYHFMTGLLILTVHQYLLSRSLESYILKSERKDDWFDANREGVISLSGYLSLYFIGIGLAKFLNPSNEQLKTMKNKVKTLGLLVILCIFLFFLSRYMDLQVFKISRRLANLSYVTWVLTVSLILLSVSLAVELLSVYFLPIKSQYIISRGNQFYTLITPMLMESINYNGLLFFLLSNIFTGMINLSVDVLNLTSSANITILLAYMCANCFIVFVLYKNNIQVRFW